MVCRADLMRMPLNASRQKSSKHLLQAQPQVIARSILQILAHAQVWVAGACDTMLYKVQFLLKNWVRGDVAATRQMMTHAGQLQDVATLRKVDVPWTDLEFKTLVDLLTIVKPVWQLTIDLSNYYNNGFKRAKLLPGGQRLVEMVVYEFQVKELLETLLEIKNAKNKKPSLAEDFQSGNFWENTKK